MKVKKRLIRITVLLIAMVLVAGAGGWTVATFKSHIALTAKEKKKVEEAIDDLSRRLHSQEAEMAKLQNPEVLRAQAAALGLFPPREGQIILLDDPLQGD